MGVCNCSMFCCTLRYVYSSFAIIFMGKRERERQRERAGCFALFVFLVSLDGYVALPRGIMGMSAVCDRGISWSYSPTISFYFK